MENAVEAIMSTKIQTVDAADTALTAAKKMRDERISSLIVVDKNEKPVGIVTERDFVHRICAQGAGSKDVSVQQIMSTPVATIDPKSSVEVAADLMLSHKVRHLLVVDSDSKPIGILGPSDLYKFLQANIDMDDVKARILKAVMDEQEMGEPG